MKAHSVPRFFTPLVTPLLAAVMALSALMLGTVANAAPATLTEAQVEAIVSRYIEKNGDKLMDSIAAYQIRSQREAANNAIRYYNPTRGPKNAPVTIVEFVDYECPFCSRVQPTLQELRAQYGNRIRWVAKYLPLGFHAKAPGASYAAQAAHIQGKYWEFSQRLWERQEFLGDALYQDIAKELKLDLAKFNKDRASANVKAAVTQDLKDAQSVGASGTPFFLINGQALSGAQPKEVFIKTIEESLSKTKK